MYILLEWLKMISYEPLFRTMKEKKMSTYRLFKNGFSQTIYYNMKKGMSVSTNTIDLLCEILDCEIGDVMVHVKKRDTLK